MRNYSLFFSLILLYGNALSAQDGLPPNPQAGKCYVRCITEDKWGTEQKQVMVTPGYKKLEVVKAEYKTVEERIIIKPASKRFEFVPAVFKKVTDTVQVEDPYHKITVAQAKFSDTVEPVITQPGYTHWEWKSSIADCKSKDPRDCQVLCFVEVQQQTDLIPIKKKDADATFTRETAESKSGKFITVTKEVLVTPPQVKEIEIPEEFITVKKRVLVKDETVNEVDVEPQFESESIRVLVEKGGVTKWEEIECKLIDPNPLPIFYEFGSARLTPESRKIIDERLYKLMIEKPLIRVQIDSHTDSRDTDEFNMDLSQRRAQSVVDYLMSKGISGNRLVPQGYGETRPKIKCTDCTEAEHAQNRRTEFRVLPN